ncbi:MAG: DUF5671 domain-containing protein [Actinomycetota bacterium]
MSEARERPEAGPAPGRGAYVISQLYHYVAAVIGVGLLLGGLIAFLFAVRTLVLPREFEEARDGLRGMLHALAFAIPGALVLWWNLREARRGEAASPPAVFWGRALYFYMVSLVALGFVLGGSVAVLSAGADAAIPHCDRAVVPLGPPEVAEQGIAPAEVELEAGERHCFPTPREAARDALDGAIFLVAGGPVLWWHLRQGRRAVGRAT